MAIPCLNLAFRQNKKHFGFFLCIYATLKKGVFIQGIVLAGLPAQQAGGRSDSSSEGGPSEARTLAEVKCGRPGAGRTHMGPTPRRGAFGLGRSRREARDPLGTGSGPRARSLQNGGGVGGGVWRRAAPRSLLEPESDVSVAACVVSPPPLTLRFKDDL